MSNPNFCCSTKQYYSKPKNLVDTLIIVPRVIICKKIQKWQEYTETITIKNKGMYPRNLIYSTDSSQDTKFVFPQHWEYDQLQPDDIIEVQVVINPTGNSVKTACRHIYIQSTHPNITFEIPIIGKFLTRCYIPKSIDFPSTVPDESTHYEFVAFNPTSKPQTVSVRSSLKSIKIILNKKSIPPRDCMRILMTCKVNDEKILQDIIKLKVETGKVNAHVKFLDVIYPNTAGAVVEPINGYNLEPCKSGIFRVSFFAKVVGAFIVQLRFKVKNGDIIETTMKGQSIHARLKIFPDVLQFGVVPFGIPCKRLVLLVNPFMVPVTVQVTVGDDGDETPLVLNVEDADGLQPITVKDYVTAMLEMANEKNYDNEAEEHTIELISKTDSMLSYRSVSTANSSCSSDFDSQILDAIPDFAFNIVKRIKDNRYLEHKEVEDCIVSEALEMLLNTDYFSSLKRFSNYAQMDWNVLPFNPKEVYCDKEIIYLQPNAGKSVTVILIPNRVGECNRALYVRICPINDEGVDIGNADAGWDLRNKFYVNSKMMTTKIWMEYVCRLPDISFTQETSYENDNIYVGQEVKFAMLFRNLNGVGGFFYYDIIPAGESGEMIFEDNITKYFISPLGQTAVESRLIFHRVGKIRLSGLIKIVGSLNGSPFHIYADVKPVKLKLSSKTIYKRQKVLESTVEYFFIENVTPAVANFTMKLKSTKYMSIDPSGAILSPDGQAIYVAIYSKFYDADTYYNTLIIDIANGTTNIEIPITYVVEGSPIKMQPNIFGEGFDCGTIMINCQDIYETDTPKFTKEVKLYNKGNHKYCFYIDKLRNSLLKCAIELRLGYVTVSPKVLCLEPHSEGTLYVTANSCEAGTLYSEFRVRAIDQDHKLKVHTTRFEVTATFVEPEMHWCHKLVQMEYNRTHIYKEYPVLAIARLKNVADVDCKVLLKVLGPFRIKQLFEHNFAKVISFSMKGLEEKEITIALHKPSIRDEFCSTVDGRILCEANCKLQRSLALKLHIRSPELRLTQPDMVLFSRGMQSLTYVEIRNISNLDAQYKWKKVEERSEYVADHDYTYQFSRDILSDILRMLDLADSDSDADSLYHRNMTLRYQKYRCKLEQLQDKIGVVQIIDEIIANLDLEHKRYAKLDEEEDDTCLSPRYCTSGEFVCKTLNDVLYSLKLEDSYDVSPESSEECDEDSKIHFVEKCGFIKKFTAIQSELFLPVVKPGYVKTATFILDTVGSCPQQFDLTLINLEKVMVFSSESVYLGVKPWYELFNAAVRVINVTNYPITVNVIDKTVVDKSQRLYLGYAKIIGDRTFDISKFKSKLLKAAGTMGFSEQFMHEIYVTANKSEERILHLRGQGAMPIISIVTKLPRPQQTVQEVLEEYELLQSIYYFDVFKAITVYDEDFPVEKEEEDDISLLTTEFSVSTIHTESSRSTTSSRQARFFRMMKSYVIVNSNGELPNARVLEQLIETQRFIKQLKENPKAVHMLRKVYQSYERMIHNYDEVLPINLKHFTTQPLPFQQQGFLLNLNSMILGQLRKFQIDFHFYGPGKLIASVRTEVKIPGLYVDFEVKKSEDHDYIFYASEKKSASLFGKRYRNMVERVIDAEMDPKVKHAHSFDLDKHEHHTRLEVGATQRKELQNYYNSLNKSVYGDQKHHFTLCKIFSNSKTNYYSGAASISLLMKPEKKYYEEGQIIEDYLYIDLHLGPTVPILLRGLITKK
ncbi:uncharacterized protein [Eurosta solidaginis]|uniref:uncharacterized protein n=1 Tax=Eurosta solidaginis TaxID=178769 RepID=UPI0035311090